MGDMRSPKVEFMGSDGGSVELSNFSGLKSISSGPAGGVVGYALTSWDGNEKHSVIGSVVSFCFLMRFLTSCSLDVGGTSTDVPRFDGRYEIVYETVTI